MKKLLLLLMMSFILILGTACSNDSASNGDSPVKTMTGEQLEKQNDGKKKDEVLIIDVRANDEYKEGHIPHAINIALEDVENRLDEIADFKDKPVILYCNTGNRSGKAADILVENGFINVTNAEGVKEHEYDLVKYEDIRGAALEKLVAEADDVVLVDVRPAKQANEEGMIEGAINIPFDEVEENLDKLPQDKTIALYCNTGTKSAEVAQQLNELGYEKVINAIEGVKEYEFSSIK